MIFKIPDETGRQHDVELHVIKDDDGQCLVSETFLSNGNGCTMMLTSEMRDYLAERLTSER